MNSKKNIEKIPAQVNYSDQKIEEAIFAGGCFWCMEWPYEQIDGVISVTSGYAGGNEKNPSYKEVASGKTGHRESIHIKYDSNKVSYGELLNIFWKQIDPTDDKGQFVDRGFQYTSAIFYTNLSQKKLAEESKKKLAESGRFDKPIVTKIIPAKTFYDAEEYHQDYYKKNPIKYKFYRYNSGRDQFLKKIWIQTDNGEDSELQEKLTPLQYEVIVKNKTEPPFKNEYWNNTRDGIYVDRVSGEVLFSSKDKFKSGTGWPSFTKPIDEANIIEREDKKLFRTRVEIRSKKGNSHLGHVFNDGPKPTGKRYCMNSAALRFIAKEDLDAEGYGKYVELFELK